MVEREREVEEASSGEATMARGREAPEHAARGMLFPPSPVSPGRRRRWLWHARGQSGAAAGRLSGRNERKRNRMDSFRDIG